MPDSGKFYITVLLVQFGSPKYSVPKHTATVTLLPNWNWDGINLDYDLLYVLH